MKVRVDLAQTHSSMWNHTFCSNFISIMLVLAIQRGVISAKCIFAPTDIITNIAENFERPLCPNVFFLFGYILRVLSFLRLLKICELPLSK